MAFWRNLFGGGKPAPVASYQSASGGRSISTTQELDAAMRGAVESGSGVIVTPETAMRVSAVYASIRIISGAVATLPLDIKQRIDDRTRRDASSHWAWNLLRRKPNRWQTPSQFRRMLTAHLILRGNAYAMKVMSRGEVKELIPLHPDRMKCEQNDDLSLSYVYQRKNGSSVTLAQSDVMHLVGLTLDGVHGVSAITYAREAIGSALAMESHGANTFKNGARVSTVLVHPGKLGKEGQEFLRASLDAYRAGGESEGKALILEEGMETKPLAMTQWIEARAFSRVDIAMFMGVPPSMLGDNSGSDSNWGTGLEQKSLGFVAYTLEDFLTTWEETIGRDILPEGEALYARFNRSALIKGDIKTRWEAYVKALQWGVASPNEIRALEDQNPREGGDVFYPPPNMTSPDTGGQNDPKKTP
jgi:HK97 family phage portal protein